MPKHVFVVLNQTGVVVYQGESVHLIVVEELAFLIDKKGVLLVDCLLAHALLVDVQLLQLLLIFAVVSVLSVLQLNFYMVLQGQSVSVMEAFIQQQTLPGI